MSITSEIKQNSITNLNLSSESFKIDDWSTGYKHFDNSLIDHQNKVYEQLWVDRGSPHGDMEYGQHAFRCIHDQWATNQEKAAAIDRFVERVIQEVYSDERRLAVNGNHIDSMSRVINRIVGRLNQSPHGIERGVHMAEFVGSVVPRVMNHFSVVAESVPRFFAHLGNIFSNMGNLSNIAERTHRVAHRANDLFSVGERLGNITKHHRSEADQKAHDQAKDNLGNLGKAAWDLAQAAGHGAAGDLAGAQQKLIDASIRMVEVFLNKPPGSSGNN